MGIVDFRMKVGETKENAKIGKESLVEILRVVIEENRDKTVFEAESITIEDPDECADPTLNDCDSNAVCRNVDLSFACSCREGFIDGGHPGGAGRNCILNDDNDNDKTDEIAERLSKFEKRVDDRDEEQDIEIRDWTGVSIAAIVVVTILFLAMCGVYLYLYAVRAKSQQRYSFYNEA